MTAEVYCQLTVSFSFSGKTECPELDGVFPDPHRKTGYLVCSDGISTRMNCSEGLVWRDDMKACGTPGTHYSPVVSLPLMHREPYMWAIPLSPTSSPRPSPRSKTPC